eukprot:TRINITY_DN70464_c0_g1_i1.p1 TRINITY_DN70464_c0_g1~~TRINITY_DN70464_c0_g1_i1.p1  ORF type:complete len:117 (-),score=6.88 TRINITY_DN70464_c0_g1_i1:298-648(-)
MAKAIAMSPVIWFGSVLGGYLRIASPLLLIKNFSKFHCTSQPWQGANASSLGDVFVTQSFVAGGVVESWFFSMVYIGCASGPFTFTLPNNGKAGLKPSPGLTYCSVGKISSSSEFS